MTSSTVFIKKGTILQRPGEINHKSYIVKKGLLRGYIIDEKGKEYIFTFASEDWIIGDMESLAFGAKTLLFIDALEDSDLLIIERDGSGVQELSLELLQEEHKLLSRRIAVLQRRILMQMSSSAIERYEHFIKTYPGLINRLPQHMIASYLGITPEALSKVKSESVRKK